MKHFDLNALKLLKQNGHFYDNRIALKIADINSKLTEKIRTLQHYCQTFHSVKVECQ